MPICINLLAEAQAAEEMRRKDPAKKAIAVAAALVLLTGVVIGYFYLQVLGREGELQGINNEWAKLSPEYKEVLANQAKILDSNKKIADLQHLSVSRFVWASVLNALSQAMTNVPNVQVTRLQGDQDYLTLPPVPASTNASGAVIPAKPGGMTERVKLTITAKDFGKETDENYNRMKEAIAEFPFFKERLDRTRGIRLESLSSRTMDALDPSKSYVTFVLECQFAEKTR